MNLRNLNYCWKLLWRQWCNDPPMYFLRLKIGDMLITRTSQESCVLLRSDVSTCSFSFYHAELASFFLRVLFKAVTLTSFSPVFYEIYSVARDFESWLSQSKQVLRKFSIDGDDGSNDLLRRKKRRISSMP